MLVSVIIATYKRDISLKNAIESIMAQTYKKVEIIVVDDNSDEKWSYKVKEILDSINKIYPIIYIKKGLL